MSAPSLTQYVQGTTIVSGDGLNTMLQTCDNFSEMRSFIGTTGMQLYARGQSSVGDGYQGMFYWNASGSGTDDNINNIVPSGGGGQWTRVPTGFTGTIFSGTVLSTSGYVLTSQGASGTPTFLPQTVTPAGSTYATQYNASGSLGGAGPGTSGYVLTSQGAASAPSFLPAASTSATPIGSVRNAVMTLTSANASATFTADQIVVGTAIGGSLQLLSSFSQTINLATTGAGGMDTGTAPVSGYVSLYAIYGSSGTSILACAVGTSTATVYAGSNLPSGYTYSALIGIWPTNGSSLFAVGTLHDRNVYTAPAYVVSSSSTAYSSLTALSIASGAPPGAKSVSGVVNAASTVSSNLSITIAATNSASNVGLTQVANTGTNIGVPFTVPIITSQTIYYTATVSSGTPTFNIFINGYTF